VKKLRLAVVGAGRLGGFHAQKIARNDETELIAVADPDANCRDRVAIECNARAVADHRQLFGQVDGVVIAAPTRLHHSIGLDFIKQGIHVLVEKPLAADLGEADELVSAARLNRVVLQVGHVERFNPAMTAAAGHVRDPKFIEATRASGFTFRSTDIGVVLDLMIHDLDLILAMVRSPVRKVEALGVSVLGGHEDVANARLEFENGCVANLNASRVSPEPVRRMSIWSSRAFASIDFASRSTTVIHPSEMLLTRRFDVESLGSDEVEHLRAHLFDEHLQSRTIESPAVDALSLELDDFVESIVTARQPRVSGEQGRDAVAVADLILAKIRDHRWSERVDGPAGPLSTPLPSTIPAPHFQFAAESAPKHRREAG
jgi:predicted dehydrogenase